MTNKELEIKKELEGTELQDNELENVNGGSNFSKMFDRIEQFTDKK